MFINLSLSFYKLRCILNYLPNINSCFKAKIKMTSCQCTLKWAVLSSGHMKVHINYDIGVLLFPWLTSLLPSFFISFMGFFVHNDGIVA